MRRAGLLLLGLTACIQPDLIECGDLACAPAEICDTVHHQCITPSQAVDCAGQSDGTICTTREVAGYCDRGVCLPIVCGNGIVDSGEACDDGNTLSGDGCNATCSSNESCGNGVVDPTETCDEDNSIDGDGCDSRCQLEHESWSTDVVRAGYIPERMVYDATRHQLLLVVDGFAFQWTGTAWSTVSDQAPDWAWLRPVYAPDRQSVVVVGLPRTHTQADGCAEWDGVTWTTHPIQGASPTFMFNAFVTYDSVRHVVLALGQVQTGAVEMWSLDVGTATWTKLVSPPGVPNGTANGFAFDEARGVAVLVVSLSAPTVLEWNGSSWTTTTAPMTAAAGWGVVYDPSQSAVLAVGGNVGTDVFKWSGTSWIKLASALPSTIAYPDVGYDVDRHRLVLYGRASSNELRVFESDGTWHDATPHVPNPTDPFAAFRYGYDPHRKEIVQLGGRVAAGLETWVLKNGSWRQLGACPGSGTSAFAYDPGRDAFVMNSVDGSTWLLKDEVWLPFEAAATFVPTGLTAITYDPQRDGVVGVDLSGTWLLRADATPAPDMDTPSAWTMIAAAPPHIDFEPYFTAMAFDPRKKTVLALSDETYELTADGWHQTLGPTSLTSVTADSRRGSLVFSSTSKRWERIDGTWFDLPPSVRQVGGAALYLDATGEVIEIGNYGASRLIIRRRFVGPTPAEVCDGHDLDADHLVDCADPDCWWQCGGCPPFASCP